MLSVKTIKYLLEILGIIERTSWGLYKRWVTTQQLINLHENVWFKEKACQIKQRRSFKYTIVGSKK